MGDSNGGCPACGDSLHDDVAVSGFRYARCRRCGFRALLDDAPADDVTGLYGDAYFSGGGAGYDDYLAEAPILRNYGRFYGSLLRGFGAAGSVLDVGCAAGFVMAGYRDCGWQPSGIEPNVTMAQLARHAGFEVDACTLEETRFEKLFDAVSMLQVLPHFYDLEHALHQADKLTRANGLWIVETWNGDSLLASLLGKNWHELSPPSVRRVFTPESLRRIAARFGYQCIASGRPPKRIRAAHAKSLLRHKGAESAVMRAARSIVSVLPDDMRLPYPGDDVFWAAYIKRPSIFGEAK